MSIATVVTRGFSISGGLSAGLDTLPTRGYSIGSAVPVPMGRVAWTAPARQHYHAPARATLEAPKRPILEAEANN